MRRYQIQKAGDLFSRGLSPERHHPFPGFIQFIQRLLQETVFKIRVLGNQPVEDRFRKAANRHIGSRLGGHRAFRRQRSAHETRSELQPDDLLAPVTQYLRKLHHTPHDIGVRLDGFGVILQDVSGRTVTPHGVFGERHQLRRRERPAHAFVPGLASAADLRDV